mmetsp:Transcript_17531/g.26075  ORF Transcript_17531/g.26075 Transcript_17531/m.26075 type:complete len:430 (+) Transcript_17531:56-1345(+)
MTDLPWPNSLRTMDKHRIEVHVPKASKRSSKKAVQQRQQHEMRAAVEEILRSLADEKVQPKAVPKKETNIKRSEITALKNSVAQLEQNVAAQFMQVEHNINALKAIVDDLQRTVSQRNDKWDAELRSCIDGIGQVVEKDKAKTIKTLQKLHKQHDKDVSELRASIGDVQRVSNDALHNVQLDVKALARAVSSTRDNVDSILAKPSEASNDAMNSSMDHGVDTGVVIDSLTARLKALELRLGDVEQQDFVDHFASKKRGASPLRTSRRRGVMKDESGFESTMSSLNDYMERTDDAIRSLRSRIQSSEDAIEHLSYSSRENRHGKLSSANCKHASDITKIHEQIRSLQAKLKTLGSSTSRACKSLSVGVSDSQHAALLLYSWADKVHRAFEIVSDKLDIQSELCPRPRIHDTSPEDLTRQITALFSSGKDI